MFEEAIAREQISAEKQVEATTVKPAVALSMARKMNNLEASPVWQFHAVMEMFIDVDSPVAKQPAPKGLKRPANAASTAVREDSIDMRLVCCVGQQRGSGTLFHLNKVTGVIEVSMREKNRLYVAPVETYFLEGAGEARHLSYESCIDEHSLAARHIDQKVEIPDEPANRINPVGSIQGIELGH